MKYNKADLIKAIKNMLLVVVGTLILAFGTSIFILPFNMVVGGVSGLSIIVKQFLPWEFMTIDLVITIITWLLFAVGFFGQGKSFALKTLVSTIVYPIGVSLFLRLADPVGGALIGTGCAVAFLGGGSTGGVDIIALMLCKVFKRLKSSVAFFLVDAVVIGLGMFITKDLVLSLIGILSVLISAIMVDKVFLGGGRAFVAHIVTEKYEEVSRAVIDRLDRTTTVFDAVGGYSGESKKIVMVSFTMRQYAELMAIMKDIDKNAFITIHRAHEINGEGWTR